MKILTIDAGTSGMKLMLFTEMGECLWQMQQAYHPQAVGDRVEMDAEPVVAHMRRMLEQLGMWCTSTHCSLDGIALTAQRSSVTGVDAQGRVQFPMMMWQDRRSQPQCDEMAEYAEEIKRICGMRPSPVYSAPKIRWIRQNHPQQYEAATKLLGFYELLLHALTGEWKTDDTVASRSGLLCLRQRDWSPTLLKRYGIAREKLCDILPVGSQLKLLPELQQLLGQPYPIAVVLAGGDQQCAALGAGCIKAGDIQINTGTGAYVLGLMKNSTPQAQDDIRINCAAVAPNYLAEASLKHCCTAVDRFCRLMLPCAKSPMERFDELAHAGQAGAGGLRFLPEVLGDAAIWTDDECRAKLQEWQKAYGEANVVQAMLEGIAEELAQCVYRVQKACGQEPRQEMHCGGGLTQCPAFCHILSRRLRTTLRVPKQTNVTAVGALLVALGSLQPHFDWGEAWEQVHRVKGFTAYRCLDDLPK